MTLDMQSPRGEQVVIDGHLCVVSGLLRGDGGRVIKLPVGCVHEALPYLLCE
jgi:hypothetical protein